MSGKSKGQRLLENAYRLQTPEDNRSYYAAFAASYDSDFAEALGYDYPQAVAALYRDHATLDDLPIADIGCGTGLVAEALSDIGGAIDGIDISPEMLAEAQAKGLYRDVIATDLTADLTPIKRGYGGVISAGTFTSGHLGPAPLEPLLEISRPGALFVIGVNRAHYDAAAFDPLITRLETEGRIEMVERRETAIYSKPGHDHSADLAMVLCYRSTGTREGT